nr:uncharacterized protein CTRU02_05654 [Colletotrichum truncatum]KAF6794097.1 hypothetical protein CTRU02_05654 [Colletotrichum truncatum]
MAHMIKTSANMRVLSVRLFTLTPPAIQEPPDVWFCYIIAIENAVTKMEKENEKHLNAIALLHDELKSKVTTLAVAVEDTAALTPIWDGMTEWGQQEQ